MAALKSCSFLWRAPLNGGGGGGGLIGGEGEKERNTVVYTWLAEVLEASGHES